MNKKEILELKKRWTKNGCTFTRLCGCYVDAEKNALLRLGETFLTLDDEEFYKYLDIAKKTLSGTPQNQLLTLDFLPEEAGRDRQNFLLGLRESKLKNDDLLERFYEQVIDACQLEGNYLILLFHDAYDIIKKTTDAESLDESEEVYEYILCAICPVTLSKAALGYREEEHRFGSRIRDWVVGAPETGFLYPAFHDRSTDIHSLLLYTKNTKSPQTDWMASLLGCVPKQTATEQKELFHTLVTEALEESEENAEAVFADVQQTLSAVLEEHHAIHDDAPLTLSPQEVQEILTDSGLEQATAEKVQASYSETFGDALPQGDHLLDDKALQAGQQLRKEKRLMQQVSLLTRRLEELEGTPSAQDAPKEDLSFSQNAPEEDQPAPSAPTLSLRLPTQKAAQVKTTLLDGKKYLLIPLEEEETALINGEPLFETTKDRLE